MPGAAVMALDQVEFGDVVFVDRQRDVRVIVNVPGRYSFAGRRNARGERRVFTCRAVYLSPHEIALAAPVNGKVGERVIPTSSISESWRVPSLGCLRAGS